MSSAGERVRVSVVVPCFQGERGIAKSLRRLEDCLRARPELFAPHEIIAVDDGSTDRTAEIIASELPEVRLLRHARNRGKGAAVRTGMLAARGEYLFFTDADVPYHLGALERMLEYLGPKEFHVCIGTRPKRGDPRARKASLARRIASEIFTQLVSRIVVTGVRDTQCGLKGFRADAARYLFSQSRVDNFAFDVEILYLAFKNDLDVKRVPVRLEMDDESSISLARHALPMLFETLRIPFRYHLGGYAMMRRSPELPA